MGAGDSEDESHSLNIESLSRRGRNDLRAAALYRLLQREGLDSLDQLEEPHRSAWLGVFKPPPAEGRTALLTVRTQLIDGPPPEITAKLAAILYDKVHLELGRLREMSPPFRTVDLEDAIWNPLQALGVDWVSEAHLPIAGFEKLTEYSWRRVFEGESEEQVAEAMMDERGDGIGGKIVFERQSDGSLRVDLGRALKLAALAGHLQIADWTDVTLVAPQPLIEAARRQDIPAGTALRLFVPDVSRLSWEQVATFREHPASNEARGRLRAWELESARAGTGEDRDRQMAVAARVVVDLQAAIEELRPSLGEALGRELVLGVTSLFPIVGAGVARAVSFEENVRRNLRYRRSWPAALELLRQLGDTD